MDSKKLKTQEAWELLVVTKTLLSEIKEVLKIWVQESYICNMCVDV